ncbi:ATP-dependent RNA helicase [Angomonas deanei]|nr:ATP-dependent RNA helicase [Angomonas deanei]|eukprot:EPY42848.1 ATP-dependent RNA helicase [Angomonas deanei]
MVSTGRNATSRVKRKLGTIVSTGVLVPVIVIIPTVSVVRIVVSFSPIVSSAEVVEVVPNVACTPAVTAAAAIVTATVATAETRVEPTATAATTAASPATARLRWGLWLLCHGRYLRKDGLVRLLQQWHQVIDNVGILFVKKRHRHALLAGPTGSPNTVHVVVNVTRKVVLHDHGHVRDIQPTRGHICRHQHVEHSGFKAVQRRLAFPLHTVAVNGSARKSVLAQEALQVVGVTLLLGKHEDAIVRAGGEEVEEGVALVHVLHPTNVLGDVFCRGAHTAHLEEVVVVQKLSSQLLDFLGEGGGVQQRLAFAGAGHVAVASLDDLTDLGLKPHVQHAVRLIEHKETDIAEAHVAPTLKIDQATGGGDQKTTTTAELLRLVPRVRPTVNDDAADAGAIGELAGLLINLNRELSGRGKHQRRGSGLAAVVHVRVQVIADNKVDGGDEVGGRLTGSGLGARHEVTSTKDGGDTELLDRGRLLVTAPPQVLRQNRDQVHFIERINRLNIVGCDADADGFVLIKVDTRDVFLEYFLLRLLLAVVVFLRHVGVVVPAGVAAVPTTSVVTASAATATATATAVIAATVTTAVIVATSIATAVSSSLIVTHCKDR